MSIKRILLTEFNNIGFIKRIANTPNFKRWFKSSKVVTADGLPEVVFHATDKDFTEFTKGDIGFHFGTDKAAKERILRGRSDSDSSDVKDLGEFPYQSLDNENEIFAMVYDIQDGDFDSSLSYDEQKTLIDFLEASVDQLREYQDIYEDDIANHLDVVWKGILALNGNSFIYDYFKVVLNGRGERTGAYFLSIQNPFISDYDTRDWGDPHQLLHVIRDNFMDEHQDEKYEKLLEDVDIDNMKLQDLKNWLVKEGYDGIRYRNAYEDRQSISWIAFNANQIKSVFNDGSFDVNDNNFMS